MTYKPITVSVRGIYTDRVQHILGGSREQIRAEFDAWLNEELAKAWDEGAYAESYNRSQVENMRAGFVDVGTFELLCKRNPYRKEQGSE